ncbi:IS66 family insertion sequence element accessory protein TnpA [Paenibacillus alba]|uniref:IS66 family insertion sequence element accessory protein TnpB n=1 Tax=Paenibacillus alba TaxID=1197127 RepID=A0ABU6G702_9BACL|nr:hypothetical protein [Paenibacillus alba]MEC0229032.1 hypothetical protein [Paenibacillus alba]
MNKIELHQIWAERIEDFQESGLSMKAWSEKTGHSYDRLSYWKNKFQSIGTETWLPISVTGETSVTVSPTPSEPTLTMQIQMDSLRIDVYSGAQPEMLRDVLSALIPPC